MFDLLYVYLFFCYTFTNPFIDLASELVCFNIMKGFNFMKLHVRVDNTV